MSNPPAFPGSPGPVHHEGISKRDWFAGQALAGQLAFSPPDSFDKAHLPEDVAFVCYRYADAMLAERMKATGNE